MSEITTLQQVCKERKMSPTKARKMLRAALTSGKHSELSKAHKPKSAWQWAKGSAAEKEAIQVLTGKAC
ncbi:hypothetical protein [Gymnodinialimonas ceratoperidinii]|uniref:Uncharacterized protein n=1 Tax=Gymnodinialimonas ceratoperidinii TaxID=2856823 RepID=A0A8F6YAV5_9RHOB|nr:hypothetical protein [Gymnodinialimonas ceratoperidinii]QXT39426.1 hypothetical protein KYE46_16115 [Gymnodinialimonas ceratoperidinii]